MALLAKQVAKMCLRNVPALKQSVGTSYRKQIWGSRRD